jgi:hypothetical protein
MNRPAVPKVIRIHALAPAKPGWGQPCNGCGVCCLAEPCPVGILVSRRRTGACAALAWNEEAQRYRCGVLVDPGRFMGLRWRPAQQMGVRLARRMISAGSGCDCDIETETEAAEDSSR